MVYLGFIFELADVSLPETVGRDSGGAILARPVGGTHDKAIALNDAAGIRFRFAHTAREHFGEFPVAVVRPATESQIAKWPELAMWRDVSKHSFTLYGKPSLLWLRRDDLTHQIHHHSKAAV